jgi:hypothetical protein
MVLVAMAAAGYFFVGLCTRQNLSGQESKKVDVHEAKALPEYKVGFAAPDGVLTARYKIGNDYKKVAIPIPNFETEVVTKFRMAGADDQKSVTINRKYQVENFTFDVTIVVSPPSSFFVDVEKDTEVAISQHIVQPGTTKNGTYKLGNFATATVTGLQGFGDIEIENVDLNLRLKAGKVRVRW